MQMIATQPTVPAPAFDLPADEETLQRAARGLRERGFDAVVVDDVDAARDTVLGLLPDGAEVMAFTSQTLEACGLPAEIEESGRYESVRRRLSAVEGQERRALGAAPGWAIGSVQAVTEAGDVLVASASGSQLPAYAYGAGRVVWVVGAQKVVPDVATGLRRIHEHALRLEDVRARKVYGVPSHVRRVLTLHAEQDAGRTTVVLMRTAAGF
jgi:LUD domain